MSDAASAAVKDRRAVGHKRYGHRLGTYERRIDYVTRAAVDGQNLWADVLISFRAGYRARIAYDDNR